MDHRSTEVVLSVQPPRGNLHRVVEIGVLEVPHRKPRGVLNTETKQVELTDARVDSLMNFASSLGRTLVTPVNERDPLRGQDLGRLPVMRSLIHSNSSSESQGM